MPDNNIINTIEKNVLKNVRVFLDNADTSVDTFRFEQIIPNTKPKVTYQASVTSREFNGTLYFDIVNIINVYAKGSREYMDEDKLYSSLNTFKDLFEATSIQRTSNKNGAFSYKYVLPTETLGGVTIHPYISLDVYLEDKKFKKLVVTFVFSVPLKSFYKDDVDNLTVLLNTLNDVIIEKIPDHMSSESRDKNNLEKDVNQLFKIFRSWLKQGSPVNLNYKDIY